MTTKQKIIEQWLGREYSHNEPAIEHEPPECTGEHDWEVKGYSYVAPSRDPYDRPEWVFLKCTKCPAEMAEPFQ